jgi:hypothetical protein
MLQSSKNRKIVNHSTLTHGASQFIHQNLPDSTFSQSGRGSDVEGLTSGCPNPTYLYKEKRHISLSANAWRLPADRVKNKVIDKR